MTLTLASAAALLERHHLLREIVQGGTWTLDPHRIDACDAPIADVTYDTRTVANGSMLFVKGAFRPEFLDGVDERGLGVYVAETPYAEHTKAPGLIVNDARKAMSLLSAEFFDRPQDSLTVIGITGTKGKTTTAYFTQAILNAVSGNRAALFSSVDNCLDGTTYVESDLTTPESLDAFRMMRTAVDNGMKYLVMEVSSQAYKVNRVYGLTFDVGAFLNISPDHISPIEHPTFEDYLFCKRQIVSNCRTLVLGADANHADLIREDAAAAGVPVTDFALQGGGDDAEATAASVARPVDVSHSAYRIQAAGRDLGEFRLALDGDFNYANAVAAITIAQAAGVDPGNGKAFHAIERVTISGRMEQFRDPESTTLAIVDYAHNFASVSALLDFVDERYGDRNPRVTLVTGSAGNKAYDRRREIVEAAEHRIAAFVFTQEDTDTEPYLDICKAMRRHITDPNVASTIVPDRATAIASAVDDARAHADRFNVLLIIGKGNERWIKDRRNHMPYEGDDRVVARLFGLPRA